MYMISEKIVKCKHYIEKKINSQDFLQRIYMIINVSVEIYRILVSSLLILFVPQNCTGHLCSIGENLILDSLLYNVAISFNFATLFIFLVLYRFEIAREDKMIKYLEVNPQNPRDNKSLQVIFEKIPFQYRNKIYKLDYYYQKITYLCILTFIINTILSGRIIYEYSLGNQTSTTFITNILFMISKVSDCYYVANTDNSIFYSAYLREHVQFNDIDPAIRVKLHLNDIETGIELKTNECDSKVETIILKGEEEDLIEEKNLEIKENLIKENLIEENKLETEEENKLLLGVTC